MRLVHTSDWHLGRMFCQKSLQDDQEYILDQFVDIVREAGADAVIIAGDLYDRAVPPADAVRLCDDVLCRLAMGLKVPVIIIAGNHDSPERLGFGAKLMAAGNVHIAGQLAREAMCVCLGDEHGPVTLAAIPYTEPSFVRACMSDETVRDHDSAMRCCVQRLAGASEARSVLIAHAFVVGGSTSESERPLIVGGTGTVSAASFAGFSYTALGHLHRSQSLEDGRVQYAGSLLKYSFDEAAHTKSVSVVDIGARGECEVKRIELKAKRDVRCIKGKFDELLRNPPKGNREDYLKITLEDDSPVFEAQQRLRDVYPNVLELELAYMMRATSSDPTRVDHRTLGPAELFAQFYQYVNGEPWTEDQAASFSSVSNGVTQEEEP